MRTTFLSSVPLPHPPAPFGSLSHLCALPQPLFCNGTGPKFVPIDVFEVRTTATAINALSEVYTSRKLPPACPTPTPALHSSQPPSYPPPPRRPPSEHPLEAPNRSRHIDAIGLSPRYRRHPTIPTYRAFPLPLKTPGRPTPPPVPLCPTFHSQSNFSASGSLPTTALVLRQPVDHGQASPALQFRPTSSICPPPQLPR